MKIKVNDMVIVRSGKNRGKTGKVIQVMPREAMVVIENINTMVKHLRSGKRGEKGQRIEFSAPLHVSKVMLLDPKTNVPTRVGYTIVEGKKQRVARKSGTVLDK